MAPNAQDKKPVLLGVSGSSSSSHRSSLFQATYEDMQETDEGRVLYLSRHGESMYNLDNRIGGNPSLSSRGKTYGKALGEHINDMGIPGLNVWTSELKRTHETAAGIHAPKTSYPELNELDSGLFDHLTYEEFEQRHPDEFRDRERNKLTFRYPGGESYVDLCRRIEPLMSRLDRRHNLLLICHQAVIRCILAFLLRVPGEEVPYIKVPLHTVLKITFADGVNSVEYTRLNVDCVDTYRPRATADVNTAKDADDETTVAAHMEKIGENSVTLMLPAKADMWKGVTASH